MWRTVDTWFCRLSTLITIMQTSTVANSRSATTTTFTAQLLRPLHRHSLRSTSFSPTLTRQTLHRGSRLQFACSASDQDQQNAENDIRPEVSKTKLADKGAETEVPKLGLPGTIATWALLIVSAWLRVQRYEMRLLCHKSVTFSHCNPL